MDFSFGLGLAISSSQTAQAQELVIDNFMSNRATFAVLVNGARDFQRSGDPMNIVGGFRLTRFGVAPIAGGPARATLLDMPAGGPMFVESGVNSSVGVELILRAGIDCAFVQSPAFRLLHAKA